MTGLPRAVRRYPIVFVTVGVLAGCLALVFTGQTSMAQVIATVYVGAIVAWTTVGMVRDMLRGNFGLDILAVVAMVASLAVAEWIAALIIVLMLSGGEALEDYAAGRAQAELTALLDRAPHTAHVLDRHDAEHAIRDVPVDQVEVDDLVLVKPAEVVPVDGVLVDAEGAFDESSLTGESLPVTRTAGDDVLSGSVNGRLAVRIRATATAANSQYQRIVALVAAAEADKAPTVRVADRFALPFTLVSLAIAGLAWYLSGEPVRFAEVLVLATPCPLLIAAPVAFMGGMSRAAKAGIIVKGGATLEGLAKAQTIAFDKTGTLTHGRPALVRTVPVGLSESELLRFAASAEQYSSHVLAHGILVGAERAGIALVPSTDALELPTQGVQATIAGHSVLVGKLAFIRSVDPRADSVRLAPGETVVHVAVDGRSAGALVLADELRANSPATIAALRDAGIEHSLMLTGDNGETAVALAERTGITDVYAELLPQDKVQLVVDAPHRPVIMVGDGVNDAPVLAVSDVGVAMGAKGATAASESADVVITKDDISRVAVAREIGHHTYAVALIAIWIGIVLSVGLMGVAAFGFIPAVAGALTQEFVDLACILYALRARGGREVHVRVPTEFRQVPAAATA